MQRRFGATAASTSSEPASKTQGVGFRESSAIPNVPKLPRRPGERGQGGGEGADLGWHTWRVAQRKLNPTLLAGLIVMHISSWRH